MRNTRRARLVLGVLLAAAIVLITIDFRDGGASPLRGAGGGAFGPVERVVSGVTTPIAGFFGAVFSGPSASGRISALQAENARLRAELSAAQLSRSQETQLTSMLQLAGRGGYRIVPASVIAAGQDYTDTVTLDAGSSDGIKPDETVLNGQGLVGTVTQVNSGTSTVLLATDASSVAGSRIAGSGQIGAVMGMGKAFPGSGLLALKLFDAHAALRPGERLVTFGSVNSRPYVPGVPIGVVTQVSSTPGSLTGTALVRPFVDFTSLGVVGVVVAGPHRDPGDSVLPPSPKPVPTVTVTVPASPHPSTSTGIHP